MGFIARALALQVPPMSMRSNGSARYGRSRPHRSVINARRPTFNFVLNVDRFALLLDVCTAKERAMNRLIACMIGGAVHQPFEGNAINAHIISTDLSQIYVAASLALWLLRLKVKTRFVAGSKTVGPGFSPVDCTCPMVSSVFVLKIVSRAAPPLLMKPRSSSGSITVK